MDYAYPCWENIASSDDMESQITLYLMSHYIMELLCFFINIQNHEELKNIVMESNILDDEVKSYITNKKYYNIKKDTKNSLHRIFFKTRLCRHTADFLAALPYARTRLRATPHLSRSFGADGPRFAWAWEFATTLRVA